MIRPIKGEDDDRIEFLVGAAARGAPSVSSRRVVAMRRRVLAAMVVAAGLASAGCAPNVGEGARGSVGVGAESVLVSFQSDDIDLTASGDAVRVASSDGEAAVVEGWSPEDGIVESPDDATRYPATVTASLRCE
ncbi:hypothetical protein HR12_03365 [Microbacterium sp. SUBG005]|nr:hypothetical protein HR12_03365 [Microbacterium sp. SUBG005]